MNNKHKIKIIIAAALSVFAITLLYFYITFSKDNRHTDDLQKPGALTADKISYDVDSILNSFGIRKEWSKEVVFKDKDSKKQNQQLMISRDVKIPLDLPAIDLNYEITNYLRNYGIENKVSEDPRTKNVSMNFYSGKDTLRNLMGSLRFIYSDSAKRKASAVCIVLDSLDVYSLSDVETILNSSQEYSVFVPLRNDKADYQSKILELKKDYLLKFSVGNEDDIEADFKEETKDNIWKSKIKSISLNFPSAAGVVLIDKTGSIDFYNQVRSEFVRNNMDTYSDTMFAEFKQGENKIMSLFESIINNARNGKKFLFFDINLSPEEFKSYDSRVYNMKKLGYKFLDFKSLVNLMTKNP